MRRRWKMPGHLPILSQQSQFSSSFDRYVCREVADTLRVDQTSNPSRPTAARRVNSPQESLLGDFLPLPLSERYPKYRKRKNTAQNDSQPGDEAGEMADSRASQSSSDGEGESSHNFIADSVTRPACDVCTRDHWCSLQASMTAALHQQDGDRTDVCSYAIMRIVLVR